MPREQLIGVISDTHGLLRPEAMRALEGADLIIHAGDIGNEEVLQSLKKIAPVFAIRGNNDRSTWADKVPVVRLIQLGAVRAYVIHDVKELDLDLRAEGVRAVISGHSHRPSVREQDGILFINPGSAGPRRFNLPVSVAHLHVRGEELRVQLLELNVMPEQNRQ